MPPPLHKKILKWLKIIIIIYVFIGLLLYFFQDMILFQPKKLAPDHTYNFSIPYSEINLPFNENKNIGIVQFTVPDSLCRGVVLYFHGNKRNIERYAPFASYFTKNNYEVWMIDYPGFGKSTGKRTEAILYSDAMEFYKMARARYAEDSIILYGKSLGTCIATQLAAVRDCKRLILETPYYDFSSVVRQYMPVYPLSWILHYDLPTHQFIQRTDCPVTILQGTDDLVITHSNAAKLIPLLKKGDEFITIVGGSHNNLYRFPETVKKIDSLLAL